MAAGNAIERSHKNISEIANYMLSESHFPYVLFLEGSNFLKEMFEIMLDISKTSLKILGSDLFNQITKK
jgi:type II restriction enzyme